MPETRESRQYGFTLTELLVVIAIIGIIMALILVAAKDGVRRAEERQTQALITKIEAALTDRIDALLASTPPINQTHRYLAALTYTDTTNNNQYSTLPSSIDRRAQVIATLDYLKAELPDVFYINNGTYSGNYPLNFAAAPYPLSNPNGIDDFVLPLGNHMPGAPISVPNGTTITQYNPTPGFDRSTGLNDNGVTQANLPTLLGVVTPNSGMFGASFTAAAAIYKNLYDAAALDMIAANPGISVNTKVGYDAADNNINGLVDDLMEVTTTGSPSTSFASFVAARLAHHTHATARSEALYGILVEGQGPLGSAMNREDFTSHDIADTDGDGMLEFVDAWGQPLQFYRWPIYYGTNTAYSAGTADSQKGFGGYSTTETRQQDPLDPNQLLVNPAWWGAVNVPPINPGLPTMVTTLGTLPSFPVTGSPATQQANAVMTYFKILIDPGGSGLWDRTGKSYRREYYSKFLVVSGGRDQIPGTYQLNSPNYPTPAFPSGNIVTDTTYLNWCESQAAQVDLADRSGPFYQTVNPSTASMYLQQTVGLDDISNQAISAPGSGVR